jgi:hypothetical protein
LIFISNKNPQTVHNLTNMAYTEVWANSEGQIMKRLFLVIAFVLAFSMQAGVMAKGQWIYPYSHVTVAAADADKHHEC